MYQNFSDLLTLSHDMPIWQVILDTEHQLTALPHDAIWASFDVRYSIMKQSATRALHDALPTAGSLISGYATQAHAYTAQGNPLCGDRISRVIAHALSCSEVNASMGRICACPTAGSCGIVPAVLVTLETDLQCDRQKVLEALCIASGFGAIVTQNATVAGAEGGCQAECGVAAGMAAAAAVWLGDGTAEQCMHAFSIALMNVLGLVCDPLAGLVQVPCAQRNASQAVSAMVAADLALGGMISPIPADEMVDAMYRVGRALPMELRETALGGMASTPTGIQITQRIFGHDIANT